MMRVLGSYKNGNVVTTIYNDGTKVNLCKDNKMEFAYPENLDIMISTKCDYDCPMCYAGCTPDGKDADLFAWDFINTLHPYTEVALNINSKMPSRFVEFLQKLRKQKVIPNITVNQVFFMENHKMLKSLTEAGLIFGLGVSLKEATREFLNILKDFPNAVVHVINGVVEFNDIYALMDNNVKILILGYKSRRRGINYLGTHQDAVIKKMKLLEDSLPFIMKHFKVVSFDNLAIEQLHVKNILTDEEWETFYQGDEGTKTFAIDMVRGVFARDSCSEREWSILNSVDKMFEVVRNDAKRSERSN